MYMSRSLNIVFPVRNRNGGAPFQMLQARIVFAQGIILPVGKAPDLLDFSHAPGD
jgi:hypothetical protein